MNIEEMNWEEVADLQEETFHEIWPYTASTPLYANKLRQAGLVLGDIQSLRDLRKVPFTYKNDIRATEVFARTPLDPSEIYAIYSSGGTTGQPTLYVWNEEDVLVSTEISKRYLTSAGTKSSDLGLVLAPLSLPVMGHCMIRQYEAVGAGFVPLGPASPEAIVSLIRQLPITSIATLPAIASRLGDFMKYRMGFEIDEQIHVRQFLIGGDFLSNARRARLERLWRADCYDLYGMSEMFGPISGECFQKNGLHFAVDKIYLEVIDPVTMNPVHEGQKGVAIFTSLWRKGFPILRYWTDDIVSLSWETCDCGKRTPRLWYYGKMIDCASVKGQRVFAKEVEECLLRFPISEEYYLNYTDEGRILVKVYVEPIDGMNVPRAEIKDTLQELLGVPVRVYVRHPGSLPRNQPKPRHLVDFPCL